MITRFNRVKVREISLIALSQTAVDKMIMIMWIISTHFYFRLEISKHYTLLYYSQSFWENCWRYADSLLEWEIDVLRRILNCRASSKSRYFPCSNYLKFARQKFRYSRRWDTHRLLRNISNSLIFIFNIYTWNVYLISTKHTFKYNFS